MTDVATAYGLGGLPFWLVIGALFLIVMVRSHATYWLGRAVQRGGVAVARSATASPAAQASTGNLRRHRARERLTTWARTPAAQRAKVIIDRWGPIAVTFSYLTVGAQTAILATAGLVAMPYRRFAIASVPGALAWAVIWGTVGLSAVWAGAALAARSLVVLAAVMVAIVIVVLATLIIRRRLGNQRSTPAEDSAEG